jgi:8-oxo-dGTP diphosphatase
MDIPDNPWGLTVKAVIVDTAGRCLLLRRSAANKNFAGKWEWPGGKVDPGEDFANAVLRETREEAGLDIEITGLAGATSFDMPRIHVVVLCLEARLTGGTLTLSHEHDAAEWVPLADLSRWDLTEHVRPFMLEYAGRKASGPVGPAVPGTSAVP